MDRERALTILLAKLREDLDASISAARMAIDEATGEQSKAENQYDTRSLEASYLARGQAERVGALRGTIDFLERALALPVSSKAGLGALVEIEGPDGRKFVLLVPRDGGRQIELDGSSLSMLTPSSKLGAAILGASLGDEIEIAAGTGDDSLTYEILSIR